MWQLSKFITGLTVLMIMLSLPLLLNTKLDTAVQQENTHVKAALTTATYDTVQSINLVNGRAFHSEKQKKDALDVFYSSLSAGYFSLLGANNNVLNAYLPFVMLIDNDGAYVCYEIGYAGHVDDGIYEHDYYLTPMTAYAATYTLGGSEETYVVQFTLGDYITIYTDGKILAQGGYNNIKSILDDKYPQALENMPFLLTEDMYIAERQAIVTNTISRLINKYLNENINGNDSVGFNLHNTQYYFSLPVSQQEWQNTISSPTVIAFYHGPQYVLHHNAIAQVVLAGGELAKTTQYYITRNGSNKFYHVAGCSHLTDENYSNASTVNTMEEAALAGAYPDPDCIY